MKLWGVSEADIRAAASEARLKLWGWPDGWVEEKGKALTCRLKVDATQPRDESGLLPFQKVGHHGRRLPYVTWEGHREFMRIIFRDHPEARIKSAVADYRGRDDFWEKHPSTRSAWTTGRGSGYYGM